MTFDEYFQSATDQALNPEGDLSSFDVELPPEEFGEPVISKPKGTLSQQTSFSLSEIADKYGIPDTVLRALAAVESSDGKNLGPSSSGALGLLQLLPETAAELQLGGPGVAPKEGPNGWLALSKKPSFLRRLRNDHKFNAELGAKYFATLQNQYGGDLNKAIRAYNQGPGNLQKDPGAGSGYLLKVYNQAERISKRDNPFNDYFRTTGDQAFPLTAPEIESNPAMAGVESRLNQRQEALQDEGANRLKKEGKRLYDLTAGVEPQVESKRYLPYQPYDDYDMKQGRLTTLDPNRNTLVYGTPAPPGMVWDTQDQAYVSEEDTVFSPLKKYSRDRVSAPLTAGDALPGAASNILFEQSSKRSRPDPFNPANDSFDVSSSLPRDDVAAPSMTEQLGGLLVADASAEEPSGGETPTVELPPDDSMEVFADKVISRARRVAQEVVPSAIKSAGTIVTDAGRALGGKVEDAGKAIGKYGEDAGRAITDYGYDVGRSLDQTERDQEEAHRKKTAQKLKVLSELMHDDKISMEDYRREADEVLANQRDFYGLEPRPTPTPTPTPAGQKSLGQRAYDFLVPDAEGETPQSPVPSLANYYKSVAGNGLSQVPQYAEEQDPTLGKALQQTEDPIMNEIRNLANLPPRQRAIAGAKLGAAIGLRQGGEQAGIIGAAIGAMAGRGAGMVQAGEYAKSTRDARLWNSLKTMGIASKDGVVEFEGEDKLYMPPTATDRLKNLRINALNGARDRTLYEIDKTNPLTGRAMRVARPIGLFYANEMLGYGAGKTEADQTASTAAMAMFANIFLENADTERQVYSRARQTVNNMDLKERTLRGYFNSIKTKIKMDEAEDIKRGLDILYPPEANKKKS